MAVIQKTCANHADRRAIGVCKMTGKAICAECSTRYEGVNYSKEGLEILKRERAGETAKPKITHRFTASTGALMAAPLMTWMTFQFFRISFEWIIDFYQAFEP